jgi:hypothetical protein
MLNTLRCARVADVAVVRIVIPDSSGLGRVEAGGWLIFFATESLPGCAILGVAA